MAFFSKTAKLVRFGKDGKAMHDQLTEAEERMTEVHDSTMRTRSAVEKLKARRLLKRRVPGMEFEGRPIKIVDLRDFAPADIVTGDVIFDVSSQKLHKVCNTDGAGKLDIVAIDYDPVTDSYVSIRERRVSTITAATIASSAVSAAKIATLDSSGELGISDVSDDPELSVTNDCDSEGTFDDVLTILANDTTGKAAEIVREAMMHEKEEKARVQASLAGLKAAGFTVEGAKAAEAEVKKKADAERRRSYEGDENAGMF